MKPIHQTILLWLCMPILLTLYCSLLAAHTAARFDSDASLGEPKIVCFGDSITKRNYPEILGQLVGAEVIKSGVPGHSTSQAMRRLEPEVLSHNPDIVVILLGTNDLRIDSERVFVPLDKYHTNLSKMATRCTKQGAQVVLCTVPPIREKTFFRRHDKKAFDAAGGLQQLLSDYRDTVIAVANEHDLPVVDLNQQLSSEPQWLSSDGVHPSETGDSIIAKHVARAVRPLLSEIKVAPDTEPKPENQSTDIVVYGGTSSGVMAAIQAARMRRSVKLLVTGTHVGGLTTGALGATDIGNKNVIGGLSREFYRQVARHYADDKNWVQETREEFFASRSKRTKLSEVSGPNATMWTFEPHVANKILRGMLTDAGIEVILEQEVSGVDKEGSRIRSITMSDGNVYHGKMFIDASYEGDLLARAGVTYTVGREANAKYNEMLNGIRDETPKNQIFGSIDPYVIQGNPKSGLIPLIQPGDGGTPGEGDHRVQAYNFRLCFTDIASNRIKLPKPDNYDPSRYELAARRAEKIVAEGVEPTLKHFCNPVWMPNRKTDINNSEGISTDFIGANYEYPDADYPQRKEIWKAHEEYVKGFWYFLSNNERIPVDLRKKFQEFGPCKDEFQSTAGWSPQMYVREARRMVSDYVMTEHNCRSKEIVEDAVGMAAYGMDSHNCQRIVQNGAARNEGDVQKHGLKPYPISYRSIVPRKSECENLSVPVCVSASHIAFGSIRMEPVFMLLGQSSAIIASLAIDHECAVQELDYVELKALLLAEAQVLKRPTKKKKK